MMPFPIPLWSAGANRRRQLALRLQRIDSLLGDPRAAAPQPAFDPGRRCHADGLHGQAFQLLAAWPEAPAHEVLALGCGSGQALAQLAAQRPRCRFAGIDPSPQRIAQARDRLARAGLAQVSLTQGSWLRLPYANARFDCVYSAEGFGPAADAPAVLAEVARVLRTGGRFVLFDALRMREDAELSPDEARAVALVECALAAGATSGTAGDAERLPHAGRLTAAAAAAGLRLLGARRFDDDVMPQLRQRERQAARHLRTPIIVRRPIAQPGGQPGHGLAAGWLLPLACGLGLLGFRQLTFERQA